MNTYFYLFLLLCVAAIGLQLYLSTSFLAKAIDLYKSVKVFRISLQVLPVGILCYFLFFFEGDKIIPMAIHSASYYKLLAIAVVSFTMILDLTDFSILRSIAVKIFNTIRILRWYLFIGFICCLFFWFAGDQTLSILFLLAPEYIGLTLSAIFTFYILSYVARKNQYEILNVFGSVLLILWIIILTSVTFVHLSLHFQLPDKSIRLFEYLHRVLPGNYILLPYIILAAWMINIFALFYVTGKRIKNILTQYITQKIRNSYEEKIIELINEDSNQKVFSPDDLPYFKRLKRSFFRRQIFSDSLLRMHELVYGALHSQINHLFYSLSLSDDALHFLHSRHWFNKIKGLRIYAELGDKSQIAYIQKLIKSHNSILRFEAQLALTRLSEDEKPLDYLKDYQPILTSWEQSNLIHFFTKHKKSVGDLSGLLESNNNSVVCFALQCIREFNRIEYRNQIINLTRHKDLNVRNATFQSLSLFEESEIGSYIISRFDKSLAGSTQICMIRSLGLIGDEIVITFLKEQISKFDNDEIGIELFRALNRIDSQHAFDMANSNNLKYMRIYEHVIETS